MMIKPSIPKGTRDFSPIQMARRNYIFDIIKDVFQLFGYLQIETPSIENLSTLMGKYGEEGDKLLFKILNSGNFMSGLSQDELESADIAKIASKLCDKGLRYDLTVPFARFVAMRRDELVFPFKRFQIQPVWRADRPQKGRYREFYQCDADIVGSDSLLNELELIQMIDMVFSRLKIRVVILMNNRKILSGIAEVIGQADKVVEITMAIDKLDKIGFDKVNLELSDRGLSQKSIDMLQPILTLKGNNKDKIKILSDFLCNSQMGMQGVEECSFLLDFVEKQTLSNSFELDLTLARGLNYYTGAIFEVKAVDYDIGSISGGGRYDNLTGIFGLPNLSGVGISFGADRIYDVLNSLNLFPDRILSGTKLLFLNLGLAESERCLALLPILRAKNISSELYPDNIKIKRQMSYANNNAILYVAIIGSRELVDGTVTLRNMITGTQQTISEEDFIQYDFD
ncbi:MAG TPA: histidine--tRNA ligase [Bacteroidaceae bacterium]|nr:histidine--tRNA ligase [Bacteroidaceae bacterium]